MSGLRRDGFTLIEMLVVISIIGIILGIVGQPNNLAFQRSRDAALMIELTNVRSAVHRFALDHGGDFPNRLDQLVPVYLSRVPARWKGAKSSGEYGLDPLTGHVRLLNRTGEDIDTSLDTRGIEYAAY